LGDTKESVADWQEERKEQKQVEREQQKAKQQQERVRQKQKAEQQLRRQSRESTSKEQVPSKQRKQSPAKEREEEPSQSIDEIVERSQEQDRERWLKQKEEVKTLDQRPRADVEKRKVAEEEDDVDISVYVGEGDEQAGARALVRHNKEKVKEGPRVEYGVLAVHLVDSHASEGNDVERVENKENKRLILDK